MSPENESPAPPADPAPTDATEGGDEGARVDDRLPFNRALSVRPPLTMRGTAVSPVPSIPRAPTISGIGSNGSVPAPPLTEVVPAMTIRMELPPDLADELAATTADDSDPGAHRYAAPRPSETMVGSRGPLHTADEANTQVDASTLTPGDAERIIAAADAEQAAAAARRPAKPGSGTLPPPPPMRLRLGSTPPPRPVTGESPILPQSSLRTAPVPSPLPSPKSGRSSYPPPPPRKANTLLLYTGIGSPSSSIGADSSSGQGLLGAPTAHAPAPTPKPGPASRPPPPPPPVARGLATRPGQGASGDGSVELSSALLTDDSGGHAAAGQPPPQPISSSSLVADPSSPELDVDVDADSDAGRNDPFAGSPVHGAPHPPPPEGAGIGGAFAAVGPSGRALENVNLAPHGGPAIELLALAEPIAPSAPDPNAVALELEDPHARRTEITARPPPNYAPVQARGQPAWLIPALTIGGALGLVVFVGIVTFAVKLLRAPASDTTEEEPAATGSGTAAPAMPAPGTSATASAPAPDTSGSAAPRQPLPAPAATGAGTGGPCVLAGAPHTIAPHALLRAGIETASSADRIALGVALADREGFVVSLDPSTFVAAASARARSDDPIRHVVPVLGATADVRPFFETARKKPVLEAAHPAVADPPFVVGAAGGAIVWAPSSTSPTTALWPIASKAPVDAMRVVTLPDHAGYAVAFRQGTSIYLAALHEDKTPNGDLARIGGLGPQIGAPAIAAGPDHVLVAWADRPSTSVPWAIRWLSWHPGTEPPAPAPFPVPTGGGGAFAMSPSLTSISGGRLVMAWTEGIGARHEVRAQALDPSDRPIGSALTVSADNVNAGQGVPALTADGRGAIVFLSTPTGATASVVAVPIVCP